jgi:phosphotriesterase-related protein
MSELQTVLGPVDSSSLGPTLIHEHMINTSPGLWRAWPELLGGQEEFLERTTELLTSLREETGIQTIVDLSPLDIGRDAGALREVAERSGMQIIMCTGHHRHFTLTSRIRSIEDFTDWFIRELEVDVEGTGSRAGVIKVASDMGGVKPEEERVLRAAARASAATGAAIYAHSNAPDNVGMQQLDILEDEGLPLDRVCIGHYDDLPNYDNVRAVAERGCWVGMDREPGGPSHKDLPNAWVERVQVTKRLIDEGFGDQILLSHDYSIAMTVFDDDILEGYFTAHPDGLFFVHRQVLPRLRELGVDAELLNAILVDHPRRFLCGA